MSEVAPIDELAEIRAELKRRGALPPPAVVEYAPNDNVSLILVAESVSQVAKSVSQLAKSFAELEQRVGTRSVKTIERDAAGNITRIIEE